MTEDEGFAGLDFYPSEVEMRAEAGDRGFDEIVFSGRDAAGDEKHIGLCSLSQCGVEGVGSVGGGGQDEWFATGLCNEGSKHRGIGVADFAGAGCGVDGNEFVAGGEDGDARTGEYFDG